MLQTELRGRRPTKSEYRGRIEMTAADSSFQQAKAGSKRSSAIADGKIPRSSSGSTLGSIRLVFNILWSNFDKTFLRRRGFAKNQLDDLFKFDGSDSILARVARLSSFVGGRQDRLVRHFERDGN